MGKTPSKLRASAAEDADPAAPSVKLKLGSLRHASLEWVIERSDEKSEACGWENTTAAKSCPDESGAVNINLLLDSSL